MAEWVVRTGLLLLLGMAAWGKSYPVDGIVVAVDPVAKTMLVAHRPIANYMGAMVMPFRVERRAEIEGFYPGVRVQFELVVGKERSFARNVRRTGEGDAPIAPPKERLKVGDAVAEFALTDQHGATVRLSDLRSKVVVIDFIYTRCPLPDVCPRLSANFATLQRKFRDEIGRRLMLVSITVDPEFDTPAVLAEYAARWGADSRGWRFLTGDVSNVAKQLGEVYWTDEGSIGHNSVTSILDGNGRVTAMVEGSGYRADQLEHLIARALEGLK